MSKNTISPVAKIHDIIGKYMLADGIDLILDLNKSHGIKFIDEKTGDEYIDFFTFFGSSPLGINHPKLNSPEVREVLGSAAVNKPSNSDVYSSYMAEFVETFGNIAKPDYMQYLFFDTEEKWEIISPLKKYFKKIIELDNLTKHSKLLAFEELLKMGDALAEKNPTYYDKLIDQAKEDQLVTIIYTSGSTGVPKGVKLTHRNIISQIDGAR